jgi:hypothetical protein
LWPSQWPLRRTEGRGLLRDLRVTGIVATAADSVVILDPARLYAESGGPAGV